MLATAIFTNVTNTIQTTQTHAFISIMFLKYLITCWYISIFFFFLFSLMGATPTTLFQSFFYPISQNKHPKPIVHCHESSHCKYHGCYPQILLFILFSETRYHPTNLGRLCCETSGTSVNKICSQVYWSDKTP